MAERGLDDRLRGRVANAGDRLVCLRERRSQVRGGRRRLDRRRDVQGSQSAQVEGVARELLPVAEKRLAEGPIAEEVHVLLGLHLNGGQFAEHHTDRGREVVGRHQPDIRIAEIGQAVPLGAHELVEVERLIAILQVLVVEVRVRLLGKTLRFARQQQAVWVVLLPAGPGQEVEQGRACSTCSLAVAKPLAW